MSGLRYLLDTNVVSDALRPKWNRDLARRVQTRQPLCALSAPGWSELRFGRARLGDSRRGRELGSLLGEMADLFPILPYDQAAAEWHGAERARLEAAGRPVPVVDAQIAAVAAVNGLTLVTACGAKTRSTR